MPSHSRPEIGPMAKPGRNGGTTTGVPGIGATPITMPGALTRYRIPAPSGLIAMPVTGPPSAPITAGAIGNGGMIGPAGGKLGVGIDASIRPLVYQLSAVMLLNVESPGCGIASGPGGSSGAIG